MAFKAGFDCWLGYSETESGTYTKIAYVRDNTVNLSAGEIETTSRDSSGWREFISGLREGEITIDIIRDTANATWQALQYFFINGDSIYIRALDSEGGSGYQCKVALTSFEDGEALEDAATTSVSMRVAEKPKEVTSGSAADFDDPTV